MNEIILKIVAEIGRWKIYLDADIWKTALNEFDWRNKVAS